MRQVCAPMIGKFFAPQPKAFLASSVWLALSPESAVPWQWRPIMPPEVVVVRPFPSQPGSFVAAWNIWQQKPIIPIELCAYSPGKYLNLDLFEISKNDYLTITTMSS